MLRRPTVTIFALTALFVAACGDDSTADTGPDAAGDAGTCTCCGTDVLVDPGTACTDAVCRPYCMGDAGPDGSLPDGSMDATTDATMDASGDATMDATGDATMDATEDVGTSDATIFDALPDGTAADADATSDASTLATGTSGCTADAQCDEGVCWDFSDYDSLCGGTVCSLSCSAASDCISAATSAGASSPASATCGSDGKCDFVGTGLGTFFCA